MQVSCIAGYPMLFKYGFLKLSVLYLSLVEKMLMLAFLFPLHLCIYLSVIGKQFSLFQFSNFVHYVETA